MKVDNGTSFCYTLQVHYWPIWQAELSSKQAVHGNVQKNLQKHIWHYNDAFLCVARQDDGN